jgi:hypothetical protein
MASSGWTEKLSIIKNISDYLYPFNKTIKISAQRHSKRIQLKELYKKRSDIVEEIEITTKLIN